MILAVISGIVLAIATDFLESAPRQIRLEGLTAQDAAAGILGGGLWLLSAACWWRRNWRWALLFAVVGYIVPVMLFPAR